MNPNAASSKTAKGDYAKVNGLELYYQIHGTGEPLVLLHGGLGSTEMFGPILPQLAQGRQVIAVDLQAHGRTADIDRPIRYEFMADDIAALIRHLGLEQADLMGYSLGAGTALRTAIQHPQLVRRLVVISTPFKRQGWYPEVLAGMNAMGPEAAEAMKPSPIYRVYAQIAPQVEDWPRLVSKVAEMLRQEYDWSAEVAVLPMPVLLVFADADSMPPSHAAEFYGLLGGGKQDAGWDHANMPQNWLAILPGTSHYSLLASPLLTPIVAAFLRTHMP